MSDFSTDFAAAFQEAAGDAGFLLVAKVRPKDCGVKPYDIDVGFERPDMLTNAAAQSTDWEIEYVAIDAPLLAEGDEVEIDEVVYRVRRAPYVSAGGEGGGPTSADIGNGGTGAGGNASVDTYSMRPEHQNGAAGGAGQNISTTGSAGGAAPGVPGGAGGASSGTPTAKTGRCAMVYDSSNNALKIYNGAWKSVTLS